MAAADGCALSVPGLKDVLTLNKRAPPPNVSVKKSEVHVGDNIYCQGTVNMYVDTSSPDIIKSITNGKPVTVNEGWRGRLAGLSRKEKAIYLTAILSVVGVLLLFVCIYFPLAYHAQQTDEGNSMNIISRAEWNAHPSTESIPKLPSPTPYVIIAHTAEQFCHSLEECEAVVRAIQDQHIGQGYDDIGYNFLVGGDGNVYEGRGWDLQGAHTIPFNNDSIGISFIGNFMNVTPPEPQINAGLILLEEGLCARKLTVDYKLYYHKQVLATDSPGASFIPIIKKWPHWTEDIPDWLKN